VDVVPQFKFGDVEELQCGLGLDAMVVLQDAQYFLHVVDAASVTLDRRGVIPQ